MKRHSSFSRLLPDPLITLPDCIADVGPRSWESDQEEVMPFGFSSFAAAASHYEQLESTGLLLGLVTQSLAPLLEAQRGKDVNGGYGLVERVGQQRRLDDSGQILGFEVLGFEGMSFHSWVCNYFPDQVYEL